jgi:hypothetical protein
MRKIILLGLFVILLMSLVSAEGTLTCLDGENTKIIQLTGDVVPKATSNTGEDFTGCMLNVKSSGEDFTIIGDFTDLVTGGLDVKIDSSGVLELDIVSYNDGSYVYMLEDNTGANAAQIVKLGGYDVTLPQNTEITFDETTQAINVDLPADSSMILGDFRLSATGTPVPGYDFSFKEANTDWSESVLGIDLEDGEVVIQVDSSPLTRKVPEDDYVILIVNNHYFKYKGKSNTIQKDVNYLDYTIADVDGEACSGENSPGTDEKGRLYFSDANAEQIAEYHVFASMCDTEIRFKNKDKAFYGEFELESNADNNEVQFFFPSYGETEGTYSSHLFTISNGDVITIDRDDTTQESGEGEAQYHFEGTLVVNKDSSLRVPLEVCDNNLNLVSGTTLGKGTDIEFKLTKNEGEDWECNIEQCLFKSNSKEENVNDGYILICDSEFPQFEIFETTSLRDIDHLESDMNTDGYREWDCDAPDCMESSFYFEPSTLQGPHNFGDTAGGTYQIWLDEETVVESIGGGGAPYLLLKEDDENYLVHANVFTVGYARFMPNGNDAYITTGSRGDALAAFSGQSASPVETETTTAFWRVAGNFFLTGFAAARECSTSEDCGYLRACVRNTGQCESDGDDDGVADSEDKCPNPSSGIGLPEFGGCANIQEYYSANNQDESYYSDSDGDGWLDDLDDCPGTAGYDQYNGCDSDPYANDGEVEEDFDGLVQDDDDMIDYGDEDGDAIAGDIPCDPDFDPDCDGYLLEEDVCPGQYGTLEGCPTEDEYYDNKDTDGDGVVDIHDDCKNQRGSFELDGCPEEDGTYVDDSDGDADGDGLSNAQDDTPTGVTREEAVQEQQSSGGGADILGTATGAVGTLSSLLGGGGNTDQGTVAEEEDLKTGSCTEEEEGDFACSSDTHTVECIKSGETYIWEADLPCAEDKTCKTSSCGIGGPLDCCVDKEEDSDGVADETEDEDSDADVLSSSDEAELVTDEPESLTTAYSNSGPVVSLTGGYAYNQKTGFKYALQRNGDYAFYIDHGSSNRDLLAVIDCCTVRPRPHSLSSNSESVTNIQLVGCEKKGDRWDKVMETDGIKSALKLSTMDTCTVDDEVAGEDKPKIEDGDKTVEEGEDGDDNDKLNEGCEEKHPDWSCQCLMSAHEGPWKPSDCTDANDCETGLCPGKYYCCDDPGKVDPDEDKCVVDSYCADDSDCPGGKCLTHSDGLTRNSCICDVDDDTLPTDCTDDEIGQHRCNDDVVEQCEADTIGGGGNWEEAYICLDYQVCDDYTCASGVLDPADCCEGTAPVDQEEICDNGIDDNSDGFVDGDDPDCAYSTVAVGEPCGDHWVMRPHGGYANPIACTNNVELLICRENTAGGENVWEYYGDCPTPQVISSVNSERRYDYSLSHYTCSVSSVLESTCNSLSHSSVVPFVGCCVAGAVVAVDEVEEAMEEDGFVTVCDKELEPKTLYYYYYYRDGSTYHIYFSTTTQADLAAYFGGDITLTSRSALGEEIAAQFNNVRCDDFIIYENSNDFKESTGGYSSLNEYDFFITLPTSGIDGSEGQYSYIQKVKIAFGYGSPEGASKDVEKFKVEITPEDNPNNVLFTETEDVWFAGDQTETITVRFSEDQAGEDYVVTAYFYSDDAMTNLVATVVDGFYIV